MGATSYQVYRASGTGPATLAGTTASTDFVDAGGAAGGDYRYTIVAAVPGGTALSSAIATIHWVPAASQPVVLRTLPAAYFRGKPNFKN